MATMNGTLTQQRTSSSSGAWNAYSKNAAYAGYLSSSKKYYAYNLQFKTPAYAGIATKLTFNFGVGMDSSSSGTLRYAICKSDANRNMYTGTPNAVTGDAHQLYSGTFTYSGLTSGVNTISLSVNTDFLEADKTYYLFIWSFSTTASSYITIYGIDSNNYHSVVLTYEAESELTYFDTPASGGCVIRVYYKNTSPGVVSITHVHIKSEYSTGKWCPKGTITINGETVLTMEYNHPATHKFEISSTGTNWYPMTALTDSPHSGTPLPVSNVNKITTNSATIAISVQIYKDNDGSTKNLSGTSTVAITPYNAGGYVYIDNGSSWDKYEVYIDNGTSWDKYQVYIDNGSSWDLYA